MILLKHAMKRTFAQPINVLLILLLPIVFIFIPKPEDSFSSGLSLYGMVSLFSAFFLCKPMVEERLNQITIRIAASPISYIAYLSSYLLTAMLILTLQNILFLLAFYLITGSLSLDYLLLFCLYFMYNILAITFCLFWNSLFKSYNLSFGLFSGAQSIMCLVSGITMPLWMIPESIRNVSIVLPTYWLPYGLDALYHGMINNVFVSLVILFVYSGVFLLIGSKRRF